MTSEEAKELTKATYQLKVATQKAVHRMEKLAALYTRIIEKHEADISVCPECQEIICECNYLK